MAYIVEELVSNGGSALTGYSIVSSPATTTTQLTGSSTSSYTTIPTGAVGGFAEAGSDVVIVIGGFPKEEEAQDSVVVENINPVELRPDGHRLAAIIGVFGWRQDR